jgi:hypothetical protein
MNKKDNTLFIVYSLRFIVNQERIYENCPPHQ